MDRLTVIAKFKAKSGSETLLHQQLLQLIAPTLAEEGCLNYDLHRSIEDLTLFWFYENWASKSLWEQHIKSEHIKTFQAQTTEIIDSFDISLMKLEKPD